MAYINKKRILFFLKKVIADDVKLAPKSIDKNGTYSPGDDSLDGYSSVEVNVPIPEPSSEELTVTPTGEKQEFMPTDTDYYSKVTVEPIPPDYIQPTLQEKTVTENGEVTPDIGYDGFSKVIVNVPMSGSRGPYSVKMYGSSLVDISCGSSRSASATWKYRINGGTWQVPTGATYGTPDMISDVVSLEIGIDVVGDPCCYMPGIYISDGSSVSFFDASINTTESFTKDITDYLFDGAYITVRAHYRSCFVAGTKISLADGTTKAVEDVTYDDELLVWNFDEGEYSSALPLWILKAHTTNRYYHLVFDDGKILDVIVDHRGLGHRIYCIDTNRFEYSHICVGKMVMTQDGPATLVSCEVIEDDVTYYNIITDYHMNLYAEGILTSTGLNNLYPIENMKFVKTERSPIPISALNNCPEKYYRGLRLGEQVDYTIERLNEKIEVLINGAVENRN